MAQTRGRANQVTTRYVLVLSITDRPKRPVQQRNLKLFAPAMPCHCGSAGRRAVDRGLPLGLRRRPRTGPGDLEARRQRSDARSRLPSNRVGNARSSWMRSPLRQRRSTVAKTARMATETSAPLTRTSDCEDQPCTLSRSANEDGCASGPIASTPCDVSAHSQGRQVPRLWSSRRYLGRNGYSRTGGRIGRLPTYRTLLDKALIGTDSGPFIAAAGQRP